ncbi:MAG TPA: hypothetical protein DDW52_02090 [Planctomycetaceae bacterium]|nr:hypothetical protein [Planctomycetaceae bacterium]
MLTRRILADNDALIKVAYCDLVEESKHVLGGEMFKLPTFSPWLRRRVAKGACSESIAKHVETTVTQCIDRLSEPDLNIMEQLQPIAGLDPGEITLLASAANSDSSIVFTGDKRCIRALADGVPSVASLLAGKIWTVEQVILGTIDQHGFSYVSEKVCRSFNGDISIDTAISTAFSYGVEPSEGECVACLTAYVEELRDATGSLLASPTK